MDQDWDAVANALSQRMAELGLRQQDLAAKANVGVSTIQELVNNWKPRRRNPKTLAALSTALGWPTDALHTIAAGGRQEASTADVAPDVVAELKTRLSDAERRIAKLEELTERISEQASQPS